MNKFRLAILTGLIFAFAQQSYSDDDLEREKLALEKEKIALEREKLAFEREKLTKQEDVYRDFSSGERWGTWALNAFTINGLGSWAIMGDVFGGLVHLGFGVGAVVFAIAYIESGEIYNDFDYNYNESYLISAYFFYFAGSLWNIYRSSSYTKPNNFYFAAMPIRNGNSFSPGLFYSVKF